jgi:hypothetical protein
MHIRGAHLPEEVSPPEVGHDLLPAVNPPRVGSQERQDFELLGSQINRLASDQHLPAQQVYREARELELPLLGCPRPGS